MPQLKGKGEEPWGWLFLSYTHKYTHSGYRMNIMWIYGEEHSSAPYIMWKKMLARILKEATVIIVLSDGRPLIFCGPAQQALSCLPWNAWLQGSDSSLSALLSLLLAASFSLDQPRPSSYLSTRATRRETLCRGSGLLALDELYGQGVRARPGKVTQSLLPLL